MRQVTVNTFKDILVRQYQTNPLRAIFGWGPPGVGKTDGVYQAAHELGIDAVDVRLGTLTPPDLRGLPVPDRATKIAEWFAPAFLPREGKGILVLDEYVQALPTMQGLAQQLVLARRIGEHYALPDGWMVVALGNRKEDRATVHDMPAQTQNRFKHFVVLPEAKTWIEWAARNGIHPHIMAFLKSNENYLHASFLGSSTRTGARFEYSAQHPAWPSPRTWAMASEDYTSSGDIDDLVQNVGQQAADQFAAYHEVITQLPDMDAIMAGKGKNLRLPSDRNGQYALAISLAMRWDNFEHVVNSFDWLIAKELGDEMMQVWFETFFNRADARGDRGVILQRIVTERPDLMDHVDSVSLTSVL